MESLYQTVKEIVQNRRVGAPVFVRCVVQISSLESEHIGDVLATVLTMAGSWLEAVPLQIYAQIGAGARHISTTVRYAGGQSAIVSVYALADLTSIDLMVLGNKGALYHDAGAIAPEFDITAEPLPIPEWLMKAVNRSLAEGEPTLIEEVMDGE